jgi:regulator of extracellular matrix RemA (YlzA/DUF370 family)
LLFQDDIYLTFTAVYLYNIKISLEDKQMVKQTIMEVNIGYENYLPVAKIAAVLSPDSNPVRSRVRAAKERGLVTEMTKGKKAKSVIVMEDDHIYLSILQPTTLVKRIHETAKEWGEVK